MKLLIDNFDGGGSRDYSSAIDAAGLPQVMRKLNQAAELRVGLVSDEIDFVIPVTGGRVILQRSDGSPIFTGYLTAAPAFEYLGWGAHGAVYRYNIIALSDEMSLDRKRLPYRAGFVARSAGDALRQLAEDLQPGAFDTSAVQDLDVLAAYVPSVENTWSQHAAQIALRARGVYRAMAGAIVFSGVGATTHDLNEFDTTFCPEGLVVRSSEGIINDVTLSGDSEPQAYVRDYFVGDNLTLRFYLSQFPFGQTSRTFLAEEYAGTELASSRWTVVDPAAAIAVSNGSLVCAGGTGSDSGTKVLFTERVELGSALVLQHGDVVFDAASTGVLGGLYESAVLASGCLAGFQITPNGAQANIQGLINGAVTGPVLSTVAGHHYVFTTRIYASEIFREQQIFHTGAHPAGSGIGGAAIGADVRIVLEVHEINPADPGTRVAASTVLYDGVIASAPAYCHYALLNAQSMHCEVAFTRLTQAANVEVRSALPGHGYTTRLVGALSDGAECNLSSGVLAFFNSYVPAPNELISAHYRGSGRSLARVINPASIAANAHDSDDGVRSLVRHVQAPAARTAADCENAALAILESATGKSWIGEYDVWSNFLPGGSDIFPGDALQVNVSSRDAVFRAIVEEVEVEVKDLAGDRSRYKIKFVDENTLSLSFAFEATRIGSPLDLLAVANTQVGSTFLADLTGAVITTVSSTTIDVDTGVGAPAGGGFEVRWSDLGWGVANDRNLVGRFSVQTFTLPRLSRVQSVYLRQYDASTPPKYSRYSAALHVDYPL